MSMTTCLKTLDRAYRAIRQLQLENKELRKLVGEIEPKLARPLRRRASAFRSRFDRTS